MSSVEGRWVGRFFEWACRRCHYVVQTAHVPNVEDAHCSGCRVVLAAAASSLAAADVIAELNHWRDRALSAEKKVDDLLDELHARAS